MFCGSPGATIRDDDDGGGDDDDDDAASADAAAADDDDDNGARRRILDLFFFQDCMAPGGAGWSGKKNPRRQDARGSAGDPGGIRGGSGGILGDPRGCLRDLANGPSLERCTNEGNSKPPSPRRPSHTR